MTAKTIRVEHPDQHAATAEQLKEAGVDPEKVIGYVNESGVATDYQVGDKKVSDGSGQAQPA
jgi:hypothetical protein